MTELPFDPNYENSDERYAHTFTVNPKEASLEYLTQATDEFAAHLIFNLLGEKAFDALNESGELRIHAIKMCSTFLTLMHERASRQVEHKEIVDSLNQLLK